jgi:hypothetical protein
VITANDEGLVKTLARNPEGGIFCTTRIAMHSFRFACHLEAKDILLVPVSGCGEMLLANKKKKKRKGRKLAQEEKTQKRRIGFTHNS